jgi:polysaccharide deacetylase family protein (PEP-CTERM system associated)
LKNALTFDVEDYFHVSAFSEHVEKGQWEKLPSRVEANTDKLLDLLSEAGQSATFFVLGWVARNYPQLVRRVADHGHEIACHSLEHRRVFQMTREEFFEDTRTAKYLLEDAGGQPVRGYRAPSFSITSDSLWAFEVLAELGFTYDSSIFPVKHPNYGMPDAPRGPFSVETRSGSLVEFPMMTLELGDRRSPLGGGAYFRILPYWYTRWGIRYINETEGKPACVYLHPWELDSDQPRIAAGLTSRVRHYIGLRGTVSKFRRLLHDFQFCSLGATIEQSRSELCLSLSDPIMRWTGTGSGMTNPSAHGIAPAASRLSGRMPEV